MERQPLWGQGADAQAVALFMSDPDDVFGGEGRPVDEQLAVIIANQSNQTIRAAAVNGISASNPNAEKIKDLVPW